MAIKHIKLFEQHSEEYDNERDLLDSIYEDWKIDNEDIYDLYEYDVYEEDLYEDDELLAWAEEDTELSKGEKAALARDEQIITRPQLAALFLRALGRVDEDPGKYLIMVDGIEPFGERNKESMSFYISIPALADAIGLGSVRTVSRTVRKFYNLLVGEGETSGEVLYPKVVEAYNQFKQRTPREIARLASEAIQNPETSTKHRDEALALAPKAAAERARRKMEQLKIGEKVYSLINSLKKIDAFRMPGKAERSAISKIASELGLEPGKISLAYDKFLSDKGIK